MLEGSERGEWTYIPKDGAKRTVEFSVTVQRDSCGVIAGYLGTGFGLSIGSQWLCDGHGPVCVLGPLNAQLLAPTSFA